MRININNIIIPLDKNQDREILKELEKKGIKKDNIEMLRWNKRSIDSRKKNDIKFIYNIEVLLKKEIDISALTNVLPVKEKEKVPNCDILRCNSAWLLVVKNCERNF